MSAPDHQRPTAGTRVWLRESSEPRHCAGVERCSLAAEDAHNFSRISASAPADQVEKWQEEKTLAPKWERAPRARSPSRI
jgi:hypothetical protein